jgi:hypothetical protein
LNTYFPRQLKEVHTRTAIIILIGWTLSASTVMAQTAEEIVAKYVRAIGGMDKITAVTSLRQTGKFIGGGGFEAPVLEERKRPNLVRQDFTLQGLTAVTAYDGKDGWKIQPFEGKKDAESLDEEEMKQILEDSDFDGPLVNYQQKGNKIEFVGLEPVDGTNAFKIKVTLTSGDVHFYYIDTDYYVPIKIEKSMMVRGAPREYEIILGDYKEVAGWYRPYSIETGMKRSQGKSKVEIERVDVNVAIDNSRFTRPSVPAK